MLDIRAGIHKMLVRIANREYPDQTASSEAALYHSFASLKCQSHQVVYSNDLEASLSNSVNPDKAAQVVCLFWCFTSQVNSYGHGGTVSSPNHTFSWASLNNQFTSTSCLYFRL